MMVVRELHQHEIQGAVETLFPYFEKDVEYHKRPNIKHLIPAWERIVKWGNGVTLLLADETGPQGIFLGLIVPDLFTGELQAMEVLWYVRSDYRKRSRALNLLSVFEHTAKKRGCKTILSGAVADYKAGAMGRMYERRGYKFHGTAYEKDL